MSKYYDVVFSPPNIEAPSALALSVAVDGEVTVTVVQPTTSTFRYTWVELTYIEDDWSSPVIGIIPLGYTHMTFTGVRSGAVWVRALGADVWGNVSLYTDIETATATATSSGTIWVPLMDGLGNVITDSGTGAAIMAEVNL